MPSVLVENTMRYGLFLLILPLAACGNDGMTRDFSLSRDSAPETMATTQLPLSMPPGLTERPKRPGSLPTTQQDSSQQQADQSTGSPGQDALLEASGPDASSNIRTQIDENSGLVYPRQEFVQRVMIWTPPAGYQPLATPASKGWFDGWFNWF
jgi:hypothetical protein